MGHTRHFQRSAAYLPALSRFLEERYRQQGYEVQVLEELDVRSPGRLVQLRPRRREGWVGTVSTYAGLDTAATVAIKVIDEDDLEVQIGGAKWLDKAAVAGIGLFASLGLLVLPASIGAWKQHRLIEDLTALIDDFFADRH